MNNFILEIWKQTWATLIEFCVAPKVTQYVELVTHYKTDNNKIKNRYLS